ncbi:HAMP domain-containing histidine kinase [Pedobacter frigidisoli]|uniref:HAMP domain-containing histidine kinase n=1 Tax=Pedobacter frigidisoli TaxID=2530455 RepID=A0A4R0NYT4_9SPHI|nr:HAMP domain-containing histidine kinase [Pedobacter frigidisoli]TCD07581.1 HAMP domain-containing histidine kinase [Pedobacter frigidisoli]
MKFEPKDSIFQYIHIDTAVFSKELSKKSLYYANIIIWMVIFFYPLLGILDYVYAYELYQTLILIKVISVLAIYAVYDICSRTKSSPLIALHMTFATIAVNAAILCNIVPFEVAPIFFLLYASLFMLFNLTVFWPASYSFVHFFLTLLMIVVSFHLFNTGSIQIFITQGAGLFIMTGFFSCFIPVVRYSIIKRNALNDIVVKNTSAQLQLLHKELHVKNLLVESSNAQLTEVVMQQEAFLSLVKRDIEVIVEACNFDTVDAGYHEKQETANMMGDNISRLEQLIALFPNEQNIQKQGATTAAEPISIEQTFNKVAKSMEEQFSRSGINFISLPNDRSHIFQIDQLDYEQLLYNLFANCIRFSSKGTHLTASVANEEDGTSLLLTCSKSATERKINKAERQASDTRAGSPAPGLYIGRLLAKKINTRLSFHEGDESVTYKLTFDQPTSL